MVESIVLIIVSLGLVIHSAAIRMFVFTAIFSSTLIVAAFMLAAHAHGLKQADCKSEQVEGGGA